METGPMVKLRRFYKQKNYLVLLVCFFFLTPILREVIQFNEQTFLNGWLNQLRYSYNSTNQKPTAGPFGS